jgi:hypothetical protein
MPNNAPTLPDAIAAVSGKFPAWWRASDPYPLVKDGREFQCMLGRHDFMPDDERCTIVVPAFAGYRDAGEVFCSVEHAEENQGDRAI